MNGWRTYLVAACFIVAGALEATDWAKFWNDPKAGLTSLGAGIAMALMRWVTQQTTVKAALHAPPPEQNEQ